MQFGSNLGEACLTFIITNIDDAFVLVTFFAEAATPSSDLTPLKITLGQYTGFTVIVAVSLIGYAVAVALPPEPIGFLGLLPLLLGVWRFFGLLLSPRDEEEDRRPDSNRSATARSVLKVALVTVMNGGDNIGTYIPLFSQTKGAEIAVYVVTYYILLGVWLFAAFLIMKQKHVLRIAKKYAFFIIPFLYIGLGIYIVVKSDCYPWSVRKINAQFLGNPGQVVMGVVTAFLLLSLMGIMVWVKVRNRAKRTVDTGEMELSENVDVLENVRSGSQTSNGNNGQIGSNSSTQAGRLTASDEPRPVKGEANDG